MAGKLAPLWLLRSYLFPRSAQQSLPRLRPAKATPPAPVSALARAYWAAIKPYVNEISLTTKSHGIFSQVSTDRLNQHFEAHFDRMMGGRAESQSYLYKLTTRDIELSLSGERTLYLRSCWKGDRLLVRIDVDAHDGQRDAMAVIDWINEVYFGGRLFVCSSPRGASGYFWLMIPKNIQWETGELVPTLSMWEMNQIVTDLNRYLRPLGKRQKFQSTLECLGSFLEKSQEHDEDGIPLEAARVAGSMGTTVRLPTVKSDDDITRLMSATFDVRDLDQILADGKAAFDVAEKVKADEIILYECDALGDELGLELLKELGETYRSGDVDQARRVLALLASKTSTGTRRLLTRHIEDQNSKLKNTFASLVRARLLLNIRVKSELIARRAEVLELGHELYVLNGFGDGNSDAKRNKRFESSFGKMVDTFRAGAAGKSNDQVWFDDEHVKQAEVRIRSSISNDELDRVNKKLGAGRRLTFKHLAVLSLTMAKNIFTSDGACPATALSGMLGHHRFKLAAHSSIVAAGVELLCRIKVFARARNHYAGSHCRSYRALKAHWFESFIPARAKAKAVGGVDAGGDKGGRRQVVPTSSSFSPLYLSRGPSTTRGVWVSSDIKSDQNAAVQAQIDRFQQD